MGVVPALITSQDICFSMVGVIHTIKHGVNTAAKGCQLILSAGEFFAEDGVFIVMRPYNGMMSIEHNLSACRANGIFHVQMVLNVIPQCIFLRHPGVKQNSYVRPATD